jgi:hypothetical protein
VTDIRTRPLFVLSFKAAILGGGSNARGDRLIGVISEGSFEGERLRGVVLPGGNDWLNFGAAGDWMIDVRVPLKTDDDAIVAMRYQGVGIAPAGQFARALRGEPVDRSAFRVRMSGMFETSAPKYQWLNQVVFLGVGQPQPGLMRYDVVELL